MIHRAPTLFLRPDKARFGNLDTFPISNVYPSQAAIYTRTFFWTLVYTPIYMLEVKSEDVHFQTKLDPKLIHFRGSRTLISSPRGSKWEVR